ncbi:uncharacterized protein E5676_scaffold384G00090 [Cucumis melo var. makuwa]|uniref:Uncharacterized protein n=1 Tax=Cucumis melo var. makuwa TaxID=1194695 RepID=A0A5D3DVJ8_CUCMM|nr:uncharacterized protein E5676_scaffold384G00090 [Cucumis melo var. makuwa]
MCWSLGRNLVSSKELQSSRVFLKLETWKKACIFKGASIFEGVLEVGDLEESLYLGVLGVLEESDSQDVRSHQSSSPRRNRNSRSSSPKNVGGGKDSGRDRRRYQSNTENTWRRPNNRSPPKRPFSCFIREGPHLARECPNKVDFHACQASLILDSDGKSNQLRAKLARSKEAGRLE